MCVLPWPQFDQRRDLRSVHVWWVFDQHCQHCCLTHLLLLWELLTLPYTRIRNNHIKLILSLFPLSLSTLEWDRIPVWTCLSIYWWRPLIPETGNLPSNFMSCMNTPLPFLLTSLLNTVRETTASPLGWLGLVGTPRGETPPANSVGQPGLRYELNRGVILIWSTHPAFSPLDISALVLPAASEWQN